jgi:hypothetical protein
MEDPQPYALVSLMVKSRNSRNVIILFTLREGREHCISGVAKGFAVNYYSFTLGRLGATAFSTSATLG